jgi:hypothetical protein
MPAASPEPPPGRRRAAPPRARQNMRRDAAAQPIGAANDGAARRSPGRWDELRAAALATPASESPVDFWGRAALWSILLYYGWFYATLDVYRSQTKVSIFDYIVGMANLVFHEAGHIILIPLGSFMSTLGGSLFQVLIPAICLAAFLRQRNGFAAAVMLWWAGQNLIDLAPYINDARAQRLQLLGGVTGRDVPGYHDWNNLLTRLGLLEYDRALARTSHVLGVVAIALALAWGGYLLLRMRRESSRQADLLQRAG